MRNHASIPVSLHLEKGAVFSGTGYGDFTRVRGGEFVFCTAMSGIEESLTDPSFAGQVLVTTVAHVGNTGFTGEDGESSKIWAEGLVCRHLEHEPSNWRARKSLTEWLLGEGRFVIDGIDTRELTILLREQGSQRGVIVPQQIRLTPTEARAAIEAAIPPMDGRDLTGEVTCRESSIFTPGDCGYFPLRRDLTRPAGLRSPHGPPLAIAVWDFGVKLNTLRILSELGARPVVLPATAKAEELLAAGTDGILLSNGPGDPAAATHIITELRRVLGRRRIFAICLGHQIVGLASGGKTYKMKHGHRGIHHPVVELGPGGVTLRTWITSQNHGFAVDPDSLPEGVRVSFRHADDGTVEGLSLPALRCESVQFHPEAGPGPQDSVLLLQRFIEQLHKELPLHARPAENREKEL